MSSAAALPYRIAGLNHDEGGRERDSSPELYATQGLDHTVAVRGLAADRRGACITDCFHATFLRRLSETRRAQRPLHPRCIDLRIPGNPAGRPA